MAAVRAVLVHQQELYLEALVVAISQIKDVEVAAKGTSGAEGLRCIENTKPDILILDLAVNDVPGHVVLEKAKALHPTLKVIPISMTPMLDQIMHALRTGANGYLLQSASPEDLSLAINTVMKGGTWFSPEVSKMVISGYIGLTANEIPVNTLPEKKRNILKLIAKGMKNSEIAVVMKLSVKSVENYRWQIMEQLDIHNAAGLVRYAVQQRIV